ncbi:MAG: NUDIX hydrolase [Chloroflexi bacterium]|nr:NUDIX hydrolase [Chloroflexota bacterium]
MNYCGNCGTRLELITIKGRPRHACPQCHRINYAQLKVGAGALIEEAGKLLLLQRTQSPFAHCWNIPAGYVEIDESPVEAVVREVFEETGLHVEVDGLTDVYFFDDDPRGNGILIVYTCHPGGGHLTATHEGASPTFFPASALPPNLAGGGHDQAIGAWQKQQANYPI